MSDGLSIADLSNQKIVKAPGSINGESFTLRDLSDCSIFLLDHTSEVEVTNCVNCQIFIGPVDGPAIFDACSNCQVAVACQQFQAKSCSDCELALYCATGPSISASKGIRFSCWSGAYPGLTSHFDAASLDPRNNQWRKVYDASAPPTGAQDQQPNFTMDTAPTPAWEVPLEGSEAPPENPVPGPDGALYQPAPAAPAPAPAAPAMLDAFFGDDDGDAAFSAESAAFQTENGHSTAPPPAGVEAPEPPSSVAAREGLQARLAAQAREEAEKRAAAAAAAAQYLRDFYESRNKVKAERIAQGRAEAEARGGGAAEAGPQGSHQWERAISMIDFNMARPNGTDLSRFKAVLFAAKEREAAA